MANAFKAAINGKAGSINHRIILANGDERTVHLQSEAIFDEKRSLLDCRGQFKILLNVKKLKRKFRD